MTKTKWIANAKSVLQDHFNRDDKLYVLYKAVRTIHARQTAQEQNSDTTIEDNGVGWSGTDAGFMSDMVKNLEAFDRGESCFAQPWSAGQLRVVRRIMKKYAGQIARIAWEKQQQPEAVAA